MTLTEKAINAWKEASLLYDIDGSGVTLMDVHAAAFNVIQAANGEGFDLRDLPLPRGFTLEELQADASSFEVATESPDLPDGADADWD